MLIVFFLLIKSAIAKDNMSCTYDENILNFAKNDVEDRLSQLKEGYGLSYVKRKIDIDGMVQVYKYSPQKNGKGEWSAVKSAKSDNKYESKSWDNDALFILQEFDFENLKCKSVTKDSWVFEMPTLAMFKVNSKNSGGFDNLFRAEVVLNKTSKSFTSFKVFSIETFSPEFGITVTKFQQTHTLSEAWHKGPIVSVTQEQLVEGKAGFIVPIEERNVISYFALELINFKKGNN